MMRNLLQIIFYVGSVFMSIIPTAIAQPSNDNCSGARLLNPYLVTATSDCTGNTNQTVLNATNSGVDNCSGTEDDDVWYYFVATNPVMTINFSNIAGNSTDLEAALYTGSCNNLTLFDCDNLSGLPWELNGSTGNPYLTVGTTYYLQVYTWTSTTGRNTTFDICLYGPPMQAPTSAPPNNASDLCSGAPTMSLNGSDFGGNTGGYTTGGTGEPADTGCGVDNNTSWLSFVASSTTAIFHLFTIGPLEKISGSTCTGGLEKLVLRLQLTTA